MRQIDDSKHAYPLPPVHELKQYKKTHPARLVAALSFNPLLHAQLHTNKRAHTRVRIWFADFIT